MNISNAPSSTQNLVLISELDKLSTNLDKWQKTVEPSQIDVARIELKYMQDTATRLIEDIFAKCTEQQQRLPERFTSLDSALGKRRKKEITKISSEIVRIIQSLITSLQHPTPLANQQLVQQEYKELLSQPPLITGSKDSVTADKTLSPKTDKNAKKALEVDQDCKNLLTFGLTLNGDGNLISPLKIDNEYYFHLACLILQQWKEMKEMGAKAFSLPAVFDSSILQLGTLQALLNPKDPAHDKFRQYIADNWDSNIKSQLDQVVRETQTYDPSEMTEIQSFVEQIQVTALSNISKQSTAHKEDNTKYSVERQDKSLNRYRAICTDLFYSGKVLQEKNFEKEALEFEPISISLRLALTNLIDDRNREPVLKTLQAHYHPKSLKDWMSFSCHWLKQLRELHVAIQKLPEEQRASAMDWLMKELTTEVPAQAPRELSLPLKTEWLLDLSKAAKVELGVAAENAFDEDIAAADLIDSFIKAGNYAETPTLLNVINDNGIRIQKCREVFTSYLSNLIVKNDYSSLLEIMTNKMLNWQENVHAVVAQIARSIAEECPQFGFALLQLCYKAPDKAKIKAEIDELKNMTTFSSIKIRFKPLLQAWHALNTSMENITNLKEQESCKKILDAVKKGGKILEKI